MIITKFIQAKGSSGYHRPTHDDAYQENKYHEYKSCITKDFPTHEESSLQQPLELVIFNHRTKI